MDKGNVICCDDITSKKFECEKKEQEIQELKSRIRRLNEMDYEVSISQQDSINIEITEGSDNKVESNDERKDSEEMTTLETKRDMEVTYLNKLLQEKADMVEELRDKIKILNKYISVLERGEKVNTKVQPSLRENPNINNACAITKNVITSEEIPYAETFKRKKTPASSTLPTQNISSLGINESSPLLVDAQNDTDIPVSRVRREVKQEIKRGTDAGKYSLKAVDRKAWLYVGRINKNCTERELLEFLKIKQPERNFDIEKISRDDRASSAFKVGIDFDLLEEMNKGDFWPQGIVIKRYRFFRGRKYDGAQKTHVQYTQH